MMKHTFAAFLLLCFGVAAPAREAVRTPSPGGHASTAGSRVTSPTASPVPLLTQPAEAAQYSLTPLRSLAPADTILIAHWDFFEPPDMSDEGWTPRDATTREGDFWHVDDFAGLGGGTFGRLVPLEGSKSMWCGARPGSPENPELCHYATLPGYGDDWNQSLCTRVCLPVGTGVKVVFKATWDSEPAYEGTSVQVRDCSPNPPVDYWQTVGPTGGCGCNFEWAVSDSLVVWEIPDSLHSGSLEIRFHFASDGAWDDQDGLWDTDGAMIVDSLSVVDDGGVVLAVEDFEDEAVGDIDADDWVTCNDYGSFSAEATGGRYPGVYADLFRTDALVQGCTSMISGVWAFIQGSPDDYSCGGHPGQAAVPRGPRGVTGWGGDQYFHEEIVSPVFPFPEVSNQVKVAVRAYTDNPTDRLVYWRVAVRSVDAGCPLTDWWYSNLLADHGNEAWGTWVVDVGPGVTTGPDLQLKLDVMDFCEMWWGYCDAATSCHSHAPLFDAVSVYALDESGPEIDWYGLRSGPLDAFPNGGLNGRVRALPLVVRAGDRVHGLSTGAIGGGTDPSVYAYVTVLPPGRYTGTELPFNPVVSPVVGSVMSPDGYEWFIIQMTPTSSYSPGVFELDLRDDLFVAGDTIRYFVGAQNADAAGSWTYFFEKEHASEIYAPFAPRTTSDIDEAFANSMEMTCLPTQHLRPPGERGDILYVDNVDGSGAQRYFDTAFEYLGILDRVDRFDMNHAFGTNYDFEDFVQSLDTQIFPVYRTIIWDGPNDSGRLLADFLDRHPLGANLYMTRSQGSAPYEDWNDVEFSSPYIGYEVVVDRHTSLTAMPRNPLLVGVAGSTFDGPSGPDTLVAYGGCSAPRFFRVFRPTGTAVTQMTYEGNPARAAIVSQVTPRAGGDTVRVMVSGVDFGALREQRPFGEPARYGHMADILAFFAGGRPGPVGARPVARSSSLRQNYPNPFNPETVIEFTLSGPSAVPRGRSPATSGGRSAGRGDRIAVTLRVYDVAGRRVRTLLDEERSAGALHAVTWDGRDDAGRPVVSGVYFYRLVAGDFTRTRKMVLLK